MSESTSRFNLRRLILAVKRMFQSAFPRRVKFSICVRSELIRSWLIVVSVSLTGDLATSRADIIVPVPSTSSSRILASIEGSESPLQKLDAWIDFSCGCGAPQSRSGASEADQMEESSAVAAGSAWNLEQVLFSIRPSGFPPDEFSSSGCSAPNTANNLSVQAFLSAAELSAHDAFPEPILLRFLRGTTESVARQMLIYCLFRPPKSQNPL